MFHVFQEVQAGRYHMNATVNPSGQKQSPAGQSPYYMPTTTPELYRNWDRYC